MIVEEKKVFDKNCCRDWKQPCCGSLCMAWRWANETVAMENPLHVQPRWEARVSTTHGYCGLAGRP